jgi:hypothetical protein
MPFLQAVVKETLRPHPRTNFLPFVELYTMWVRCRLTKYVLDVGGYFSIGGAWRTQDTPLLENWRRTIASSSIQTSALQFAFDDMPADRFP